MKPFRKAPKGAFYVDVRWTGYPRIQASTRTTSSKRAEAMIATLVRLRTLGRRDILGQVAAGRLKLDYVHDLCIRDIEALDEHLQHSSDHALRALVEKWLSWLRSPSTLAPRTRKRYAGGTVDRYAQSWRKLLSSFPAGREPRLSDITKGFLADYRKRRLDGGCSGATLNRDMVAVQSFRRWLEDEESLQAPQIKVPKERETAGRERWLDSDEIAAVRRHCPEDWWPFYATLIHCGVRVSEAQGLTWKDINFEKGLIEVRGDEGPGTARRLKSESSTRQTLLTKELSALLISHAGRVPNRPVDRVFTGRLADRHAAHKKWVRLIRKAGLPHATLHDLRHTFGVHALIAGVPLPRLQRLMGHATPAMTLRYCAHLPQTYFEMDAELLGSSLAGDNARTVGPTFSLVDAVKRAG